jgi:hypothetical protein
VLLVSPVAWSGITDEGTFLTSLNSTFEPGYGSGVATVLSRVYTHNTTGDFIYTYVLSNARVNLSFFSVELYPNVTILDWGVDLGPNQPLAWEPVNNPFESVEAFFKDPIESGEVSAMLWFISPQGPALADGSLAGITGGSYNFLVGEVLTPQVPEPATWMLLIAGGLFGRLSRKRK